MHFYVWWDNFWNYKKTYFVCNFWNLVLKLIYHCNKSFKLFYVIGVVLVPLLLNFKPFSAASIVDWTSKILLDRFYQKERLQRFTLTSSHRRCSVTKAVLKNFAIFTGKHLCWSLFFIKLQLWSPAILLKRDSNTGLFLWILPVFSKHLFRKTSAASDPCFHLFGLNRKTYYIQCYGQSPINLTKKTPGSLMWCKMRFLRNCHHSYFHFSLWPLHIINNIQD